MNAAMHVVLKHNIQCTPRVTTLQVICESRKSSVHAGKNIVFVAFNTVNYTSVAPAYPWMNALASALLLEIQMQDPVDIRGSSFMFATLKMSHRSIPTITRPSIDH